MKILHLNSKANTRAANVERTTINGADTYIIKNVGSMICDTVMNRVMYPELTIKNMLKGLKDKKVHAPASHPENKDGEFILAGSPEAIAQNYIGAFAYNYRMIDDRLVHDLNIDIEIAMRSDEGKEIIRRIENQEDIDTSTGLLIYEADESQGYGKCGTMFNMIALEMELDHDAILVNEPGAATSKQGVGVFANSKCDVESFSINSSIANLGLEILDIEYDPEAAIERIKEFTSSKDMVKSNYRRFFLYFDPDNLKDFDAYKFPFADIVGGKPVAVKSAIIDAKEKLGSSDLSDEDKKLVNESIEVYMYRMKKAGLVGNAWNSIRTFIFGKSKSDQLEDKIFEAINANLEGELNIPLEVNNDSFIFKASDGRIYKKGYNLSDDVITIDENAKEVTQNISYEEKGDQMKDMIIKLLTEAGVEGVAEMTDEQLLAAYAKMASEVTDEVEDATEETAENAETEGEETAENAEEETVTVSMSDLESMIEKKVAEKMAGNSAKDPSDLVQKAIKLGINKADAEKMSEESLKAIISMNGTVAFNARSEYNSDKSKTTSEEMPD